VGFGLFSTESRDWLERSSPECPILFEWDVNLAQFSSVPVYIVNIDTRRAQTWQLFTTLLMQYD